MSAKPIDLLIGGGGSVGLCLAIFATNLGLSVRIVEQSDPTLRQSRADILNCRSLETFSLVSPTLTTDVRQPSLSCGTTYTYRNGHLNREITLTAAHCQWKQFSFLPQRILEQVLRDHLRLLGVEVECPKVLNYFDVSDSDAEATAPIQAIVKHVHTGKEELILASYLVGCDGSKSFTRQQSGTPFLGEGTELSWYSMYAKLSTNTIPTKNATSILHSDSGMVTIYPVMNDYYRIGMKIQDKQEPLSQQEVEGLIKKLVKPFELEFSAIDSFQFYVLKELIATEFCYKDRVFLAGDACHVHSPSGSFGLNSGIADAFDLAWKLYLVKHGLVAPDFLKLYQEERRDVALRATQIAARISRYQGQRKEPSYPLGINSNFQKEFTYAWTKHNDFITGLGIENPLTLLSVRGPEGSLAFSEPFNILAGQRFPDAPVIQYHFNGSILEPQSCIAKKFLYDQFCYSGTFRIFIFPGDISINSSILISLDNYLDSSTSFTNRYKLPAPTSPPLFQTITIFYYQATPPTLPPGTNLITHPLLSDDSSEDGLYSILGIDPQQGAIFVLRPDFYIGCAVLLESFVELEKYFDEFLVKREGLV